MPAAEDRYCYLECGRQCNTYLRRGGGTYNTCCKMCVPNRSTHTKRCTAHQKQRADAAAQTPQVHQPQLRLAAPLTPPTAGQALWGLFREGQPHEGDRASHTSWGIARVTATPTECPICGGEPNVDSVTGRCLDCNQMGLTSREAFMHRTAEAFMRQRSAGQQQGQTPAEATPTPTGDDNSVFVTPLPTATWPLNQ